MILGYNFNIMNGNKIKKLLVILVLIFSLCTPPKVASGLIFGSSSVIDPIGLAEAIWNVFIDVFSSKGDEALEQITGEKGEEQGELTNESMKESFKEDLSNLLQQDSFTRNPTFNQETQSYSYEFSTSTFVFDYGTSTFAFATGTIYDRGEGSGFGPGWYYSTNTIPYGPGWYYGDGDNPFGDGFYFGTGTSPYGPGFYYLDTNTNPYGSGQNSSSFGDIYGPFVEVDRIQNFGSNNWNNDRDIGEIEYRQSAAAETDSIVRDIMNNLDAVGIFDIPIYPLTREETESLLIDTYYQRIFGDLGYNAVKGRSLDGEERTDTMSFRVNPQFVSPGDEISITLLHYGTDLDNAYIEWYDENGLILAGTGKSLIEKFKVNEKGLPETISVIVRDIDDTVYEKSITIRPAEIALIYETDTLTPPFYDGKTDVTFESLLKVVALPHVLDKNGNKTRKENLVYKWRVNNDVILNQSGRGENVLYYQIPYIDDEVEVSVEISDPGSNFSNISRLDIELNNPEILFYQDHPTLGVLYNKATGSEIDLFSKEISLLSFPLFFNKNGSLSFSWFMNGKLITGENNDTISLRNENNQEGASEISTEVTNLSKKIQKVISSFNVKFTQ